MTGHRASQKPDQAAVSTERSTGVVATGRRTGLVACLPDHRGVDGEGVGLARSVAEQPCVKRGHQVSLKPGQAAGPKERRTGLAATKRRTRLVAYLPDHRAVDEERVGLARRLAEKPCVKRSHQVSQKLRATGRKCFHRSTSALPLRKKFAPRRQNASTEALPLRKKFAPRHENASTASLHH